MKSRLFYAVICYGLSVLLLFVSVPVVKKMTYPKTSAVHTIKPLEKGEQITKAHIGQITIGSLQMPDDLIIVSEDVIGRYAAVDLVKGDILFQSKLSQLPMEGDFPKNILPAGNVSSLISLKMIEGSKYPLPETGDVVKLNLFDKKLKDIPELQFIRILSVLPQEEGAETVTVTVSVNMEQKKYLQRHKEDAYYASVIVRSNEELAEKLLQEQEDYFGEEE